MAGNTPTTERKSMTFSVNNIFQAKIKNGADEKKVDLFSWRMNSKLQLCSRLNANRKSSIKHSFEIGWKIES